MPYLFTSESVSEGHPDKIADQISDALVDNFLAWDAESKIACETLVTTGQVVLAGEVKCKAYIDVPTIARAVIAKIGYTKSEYMFEANSCGVLSAIHEQSPDINQGVDKQKKEEQGAGDQGMMFGYATAETANYMPLALDMSHALLRELAAIRREGKQMKYLRPDAKSQVTLEYDDDNRPVRIDAIVISTQHDDFAEEAAMQQRIAADVKKILIPRVMKYYPEYTGFFNNNIKYHINPTGKFVIGGPHGDTGLTGRKIIVDTYGGKGAHGGGAFSGKDPSKVDRSAAYATRHIAKNLVAAGLCTEVLVQVSYAIGVAQPTSINVNTYGTAKVNMTDGEIARIVEGIFDMRPYFIEQRLKLRQPMYSECAAYGHMGRTPEVVTKVFRSASGQEKKIKVELFTWEKLDHVQKVKQAFGLGKATAQKAGGEKAVTNNEQSLATGSEGPATAPKSAARGRKPGTKLIVSAPVKAAKASKATAKETKRVAKAAKAAVKATRRADKAREAEAQAQEAEDTASEQHEYMPEASAMMPQRPVRGAKASNKAGKRAEQATDAAEQPEAEQAPVAAKAARAPQRVAKAPKVAEVKPKSMGRKGKTPNGR